jgi:uncharacterized protein YdbL (DUF1318 family)
MRKVQAMTSKFRIQMWRSAFAVALAMVVLACSAISAQAIGLQTAKAQGLVGEQANGYLGIVKPPGSADLQKLVADINLKRRALYQKRAAAMSPPVSLQQYEVIAGATLIKQAKSGEYVRKGNGGWTKVP